jgi:putative serine protease PepD
MFVPEKLWSAGDPPRQRAPEPAPEPPQPPFVAKPPATGRRRIPAVAALLAAVLATGGVGYALQGDSGDGDTTRAARPATTQPLPGLRDSGNSVRDIYRAASPAVVSVRTGGGQGTGFLTGRDGTIVTNAHVVGSARSAQVTFGDDGRSLSARIVGTDPSTDLAVLRVDASAVRDVEPLPLADSQSVQVGDEAVAIGNPFGLDRTATAGIVSALEREITAPNGFSIDEVIQTDAPINPGNSGGPLLNTRGQVIGVNSQIASSGGGNVGIGFAVPSNTVREIVPRLERGETIERAWLGVTTSPGAGGGVRVESVQPGSPAQRAGLRSGDVIERIDGRAATTPEDVAAAIEDERPRASITIELRSGRSIQVELGERPANNVR